MVKVNVNKMSIGINGNSNSFRVTRGTGTQFRISPHWRFLNDFGLNFSVFAALNFEMFSNKTTNEIPIGEGLFRKQGSNVKSWQIFIA